MFISPEIKEDLQLEQAEFQSIVSGEDVSVARKNETPLCLQWRTPGILGGNQVPGFKDNSGSVLRRTVAWNCGRQVSEDIADPHLEHKLDLEIPNILCKCLRAYLEYSHLYSGKDIWSILPTYFKTIKSQIAQVTSTIHHFLSCDEIRFGKDLYIPQKVFVEKFNEHCRRNNLGTPRFTPDFYAGAFSARELEVRQDSRLYRGQPYSTQHFIFGVDTIPLTGQ
jgi:hypothetical protein